MKPALSSRTLEIILVIAIILVAIIFRFAQFKQVPPGLHYDEAIDAKLAQEIRAGAWPIYFEEGWGREPLYHYLVAFTLDFVVDPTAALRLVSGLLGLIQLLAAYVLYRRLFGIPTALIGAAWIAVMFWTVSTSRAGLRNITLTTLATLTALAFWNTWGKKQGAGGKEERQRARAIPHSAFIIPGALLGLTLYTYQPGRVVPLIYLVFVIYLALFNRIPITSNLKSWTAFFGVALIMALPLIGFLAAHPNAETGRAFQTEPIRALMSGDPRQVIDTAAATLKMFTFDGGGDPQILYNVTGRPIFIGLGSVLFCLGLLVCLVRVKRPAYAFMLIWLIVTLLPNMVTAPAPFFYRAIAAQTAVMVMPAIGSVAVGELLRRRWTLRIGASIVVVVIAASSLGQTALTTWHDYFAVWGRDGEVRFQYSAAHTGIAQALDASADTSPVAISGYFVEDADPIIFDQTLIRRDLSVRWFDARESLIAAAAANDVERLAIPSYTPLNDQLKLRFLNGSNPLVATTDFVIYRFNVADFRATLAQWGARCADCPIAFDGNVALIGLEHPAQVSRADKTVSIMTAWRVLHEGQPSSTAIFIHLLDANGRFIDGAQDDRLGVPRHTWQRDDEFVQLHRIPIANLSPGKYTLELGIYNRADQARWTAIDRSGQSIDDHVLLGSIEVQP
jgi:4-amino-4-deoxy-L-arabinose transferase-like glycosyltransferase